MVGIAADRQRRRHLHEQILIAAVLDNLHEAAHRAFRRVIGGQAGLGKQLARLGHATAAKPAAQHVHRGLANQRQQRLGDFLAGHDRGGRMNEQQGIGIRVAEQHLKGLEITLGWRIADDVDRIVVRPGRRQDRVQLAAHRGGQFGQMTIIGHQGIGRHHARAPTVGDDGQAFAHDGPGPREGFHRLEQILGRIDAQHTGAAQDRVVDQIRTRHGTGMTGSGTRTFRRTASLDDHYRLGTRRGARRRHELAAMRDILDIQQDGARFAIACQIIKHITNIHVGAVAYRDEARKTNAVRLGPVKHPGHERA